MDYSGMSKHELESTLKRLQADLEDLEETITFNFSHSAAHIGGGQVRKDEEALGELKEKIAGIKAALSQSVLKN
jgi:hypothetical protein